MTAVAVRNEKLEAMGAQVLSCSTDSRFSHKVWQETELSKMVEGGVPFPMLSDPDGKIGSVYGVHDAAAGVNNRGRFIIDPDGKIQAIEILTPSVGRNPDELIRQLAAFIYVRETGEATPSGWEPGDPTLRRAADEFVLLVAESAEAFDVHGAFRNAPCVPLPGIFSSAARLSPSSDLVGNVWNVWKPKKLDSAREGEASK